MGKPTDYVNISFLRVVEVNVMEQVEEEHGSMQGKDQLICELVGIDSEDKQTDRDEKKSFSTKRKAVIHQELLEASSEFFENALEEERWSWKEAKEKTISIPEHDAAPLEVYTNWLYGANLDISHSWGFLIVCYIFADCYRINHFARDIISLMLSKLARGNCWVPSLEEVTQAYNNTPENSGLRKLMTECVVWNGQRVVLDAEPLLKAAPIDFALDYAITASRRLSNPGLREPYLNGDMSNYFHPFTERHNTFPRTISNLSLKLSDFKHTISFKLDDSTEAGVIHLSLLGKTALRQRFRELQCEIIDVPNLQTSIFMMFSSWLYFDDNLGAIRHEWEKNGDTECLLKCHEAAISLLNFEFKDVLEGDRPSPANAGHLSSMLHFQSARFKDDIIDTIAAIWKQQRTIPSSEEVILAYSITKAADDPLRKLIADFYIWNGGQSAIGTINLEFQRDLSNSVIASHAQMRVYLDQIRHILEPTESKSDTNVVEPRPECGEWKEDMPEQHYGCEWGCGETISDLKKTISDLKKTKSNPKKPLSDLRNTISDLTTALERERSKLEGIARMRPSAPYESDMARFHEAPRYRDAFEQALENIYCE